MTAATGTVAFHPLVIRPDDDDPDAVVVGRPAIGEFVELPTACAEAIRLLRSGRSIADTEAELAATHGVELDVAELVEALAELGFVRETDGRTLPDPGADAPPGHFPSLTERHVAWLFTRPARLLWLAVVGAALLTLLARPELVPRPGDFFFSDYVGLCVLVNTLTFSVAASAHEMMHLAAARSLGAPARIEFGTRLHYLVVQTNVTAIWGVPRRRRYRVYLAGLASDVLIVATLVLVLAYAAPESGAGTALLEAAALTVLLCMPLQAHVYMRTDLYYVLRDLLRCRNLFDDGRAYVRHLLARATRRKTAATDPTAGLATRQRRAIRVYAVGSGVGTTVALAVFAGYGAPIMISGAGRALSTVAEAFRGGPVLPAVDAGLIVLVEGALYALFAVTFVRGHRHWFGRKEVSTR